jgi:hypothetical protein
LIPKLFRIRDGLAIKAEEGILSRRRVLSGTGVLILFIAFNPQHGSLFLHGSHELS